MNVKCSMPPFIDILRCRWVSARQAMINCAARRKVQHSGSSLLLANASYPPSALPPTKLPQLASTGYNINRILIYGCDYWPAPLPPLLPLHVAIALATNQSHVQRAPTSILVLLLLPRHNPL